MTEDTKRLAYALAALAEQDLMFHGNTDEWYTLTLYLPGMTKLISMPTHIVREVLDELVKAMPEAIKQRHTGALAKGWIMLEIKVNELTK